MNQNTAAIWDLVFAKLEESKGLHCDRAQQSLADNVAQIEVDNNDIIENSYIVPTQMPSKGESPWKTQVIPCDDTERPIKCRKRSSRKQPRDRNLKPRDCFYISLYRAIHPQATVDDLRDALYRFNPETLYSRGEIIASQSGLLITGRNKEVSSWIDDESDILIRSSIANTNANVMENMIDISCADIFNDANFHDSGRSMFNLLLAISGDHQNSNRWYEITDQDCINGASASIIISQFILRIIHELSSGSPGRRFCFSLHKVHATPEVMTFIQQAGYSYVIKEDGNSGPVDYVFNTLQHKVRRVLRANITNEEILKICIEMVINDLPVFTPYFRLVGYQSYDDKPNFGADDDIKMTAIDDSKTESINHDSYAVVTDCDESSCCEQSSFSDSTTNMDSSFNKSCSEYAL